MTVKDTDKGFKKLVARLGRTVKDHNSLLVGILGDKADEEHGGAGGESVGQIAAAHEFGLGVPERTWLRGWFDANQAEIKEDLRKVSRGVISGRFTQDAGLEILGVKYAGQIQARMATSIPPPLAPATVARKGSSVSLIDTGQMRSAVSFVLSLAQGQTP